MDVASGKEVAVRHSEMDLREDGNHEIRSRMSQHIVKNRRIVSRQKGLIKSAEAENRQSTLNATKFGDD